jgi:hypothetical protein
LKTFHAIVLSLYLIFFAFAYGLVTFATLGSDQAWLVLVGFALVLLFCALTTYTLIADLFAERRAFPWWPRLTDYVALELQLIALGLVGVVLLFVFIGTFF